MEKEKEKVGKNEGDASENGDENLLYSHPSLPAATPSNKAS
jgi:hypothetical protein